MNRPPLPESVRLTLLAAGLLALSGLVLFAAGRWWVNDTAGYHAGRALLAAAVWFGTRGLLTSADESDDGWDDADGGE